MHIKKVLDFLSRYTQKHHYVILVHKQIQENEITKRWFIIFYEVFRVQKVRFLYVLFL